MTKPPAHNIAIIGAGAAGLAAAIFAAEAVQRTGRPISIVLIDGAKKPGAKILVSGGGRCNVTNAKVTEADYFGGSPNIIRNVLRRFSAADTVAWMRSLGVELKQEEPWGKLFPVSDSARTVLDALLTRVRDLGIETRFGFRATNLTRDADGADAPWQIRSVSGETITARRVIMATGGKALPKSGSDGAGYEWLRRLGHTIVLPVPALAPLVLDERGVKGNPLSTHFAELSGVAIDAWLSAEAHGSSTYGPVLFTHFGLSGPAPMNLSRHLARERADNPAKKQYIGLIFDLPEEPGQDRSNGPLANSWLLLAQQKTPRATIANVLSRVMPDRLAQLLASTVGNKRMCDITRDDRQRLVDVLAGCRLAVKGDRGFAFAEATAGGVVLDEINWRTMESRKAPGLYLCGEVLDVDGRIGGYNFQWAWSTGHIAGTAAAS